MTRSVVGKHDQRQRRASSPAQKLAGKFLHRLAARREEVSVILELLGELAGAVMTEPFALCRAGGALDHFEHVAAQGHDVVARYADGFISADPLVHLSGGQRSSEPQPMKNCLALSDGLVHGESSMWVACFVSTRAACWMPLGAGESADG